MLQLQSELFSVVCYLLNHERGYMTRDERDGHQTGAYNLSYGSLLLGMMMVLEKTHIC